jgi:hypothetical protein
MQQAGQITELINALNYARENIGLLFDVNLIEPCISHVMNALDDTINYSTRDDKNETVTKLRMEVVMAFTRDTNIMTITRRLVSDPALSKVLTDIASKLLTSTKMPELFEKLTPFFVASKPKVVAVTEIAKQFTTTEMIKTKLRDYSKQTSLWYAPLEEENVGLRAMHEVTCDSYKHITRTSQRRPSISRLKSKDGELIACHTRGSVGRAKSDKPSPLMSNIMHEYLSTDARLEWWAGRTTGSVQCACGKILCWKSREEIGQLQWHMLAELSMEMRVRQNWLRAIADTVDKATNDQIVRDALMATWSTRSDGVIAMAVDDEDNFWRVPSMNGTTDGGFVFRKDGSLPTFDP